MKVAKFASLPARIDLPRRWSSICLDLKRIQQRSSLNTCSFLSSTSAQQKTHRRTDFEIFLQHMSHPHPLFQPLRTGAGGDGPLDLAHRIALAPLTRNRASEPNLCAHDLHVEYYAQRASPGGLLITEATCISPEAVGYMSVPGIWTEAQTRSWRDVTNAVHARGGKIFMQLWHTGRVAQPSYGEHPMLRASGKALPSVSASDLGMTHPKTGKPLQTLTYKGPEECAAPRALSTEEVSGRLRHDYVHAARNAMRAGFDGVELHAAHGYLVDQFIQDGTNKRTDQYGGTVENRCRLLFELCEAIVPVVSMQAATIREKDEIIRELEDELDTRDQMLLRSRTGLETILRPKCHTT